MFKTLLIKNRIEITKGPLQKLYKIVELPFLPNKDCDIEYQDGWALSKINYIYLSLDGSIELGLDSILEHEAKELLATGEWFSDIPKTY